MTSALLTVSARSRSAASSAPLWGLVAAGAVLLVTLGLLVAAPSTFPDEAVYTELARNLGVSGRFDVLGVHLPALTYGPAYVVLLAPIFRLSQNAEHAYVIARAVGALLFAS